ncbi:hypothetical protein WMY93_014829 [Mugilogobius chulae]|uniref:Immunoglobulin subtype domain-containing protein n=1 Tax=Mugilogobius chulae TaxID=88201 RepID=A0AAW0P7P7_9GOBI
MRTALVLLSFLVLLGEKTGFCSTEIHVFTATEGEYFENKFVFYEAGTLKVLCKNDCMKKEDILIETRDNKADNGKHSIVYEEHSHPHSFKVGIRNVISSDSGLYNCEIWSEELMMESVVFQIEVINDSTGAAAPSSVRVKKGKLCCTPPSLLLSHPSPLLWLLAIPVTVVTTSVLVLLIWRKKRAQNDVALAENSRSFRAEVEEYANISTVSDSADDTYQSLCADTMDPNQVYSSI